MRTLGLIELKRPGKRFQDALADPVQGPALEAYVVVDADPGEEGHFLPAEPGDAPFAAKGRQACPFRRDPGPPGGKEVADLVPIVHDEDATPASAEVGGSVITWINRHSHIDAILGLL